MWWACIRSGGGIMWIPPSSFVYPLLTPATHKYSRLVASLPPLSPSIAGFLLPLLCSFNQPQPFGFEESTLAVVVKIRTGQPGGLRFRTSLFPFFSQLFCILLLVPSPGITGLASPYSFDILLRCPGTFSAFPSTRRLPRSASYAGSHPRS